MCKGHERVGLLWLFWTVYKRGSQGFKVEISLCRVVVTCLRDCGTGSISSYISYHEPDVVIVLPSQWLHRDCIQALEGKWGLCVSY